jgi:crotonobetainyl-CoA:carnitine CoA-transferase CaiB-like acyl-CoA transferase
MQNNGALKGIKIIDLSRLLPGPYCSMILADHGAEVISIEDKRFIKDKSYLKTLYRNKKHISINLKSKKGKEIFFKLVKNADVVLEQFRPGVVEKLGVDYQTVSKKNPKIIYCSITGYGQKGSRKDRVGHDVNYLAEAGVLDLIGEANRKPVIPGVQFADIAGGSMNAVIGVLLALQARNRTGEGQYIDISMTDSAVSFFPTILFFKEQFKRFPERGNSILSHRYAFYNIYETADGRYISIGAAENRFWKNLCEHLGVPEYGEKQYDEKMRKKIIKFMREAFKSKTLAEWEFELKEKEVCFAPVRKAVEVFRDPEFIDRGTVVKIESKNGAGKQPAVGIPIKLSKTSGSVRTPPVDFGEDTQNVLMNLGYTKEEVVAMFESGVV